MHLVEKHTIKPSHPFYKECDALCFKSKNIYNKSLYEINKRYEDDGAYLGRKELYHHMKQFEVYNMLPKKVFGCTLDNVSRAYNSFFALLKKKQKGEYEEEVKPPFYKHKKKGRYLVTYPKQAISSKVLKEEGKIHLSQTNIKIKTRITNYDDIAEVKISPKANCYVIVVVYKVEDVILKEDNGRYMGIDMGLNNFIATGSNVQGLKPVIISGKPLKSINHYYNKELVKKKSNLTGKQKTSKAIKKLTLKRNNKIGDFIHKATKVIADYASQHNISKVYVGKNKEWKQNINIGKKNNQNFVCIPHARAIDVLRYKLALKGIELCEQEESYTSKCSFLDLEPVRKHTKYKGYRQSRGNFKASNGVVYNADTNGALNILRKAAPNAFSNGVQGVGVHPQPCKIGLN